MASNTLPIEQLLLKLQESEQRAQESEKRAQDKQRIRQEAERKLQMAENKARGLPWLEALSLWHIVFSNPQIRYRYETVQPSSFTTAIGRRHPKQLVHWTNFHREHKSAFSLLCSQFPKSEAGSFKSREVYQQDAERFMSHCVLDDEVALVAYE